MSLCNIWMALDTANQVDLACRQLAILGVIDGVRSATLATLFLQLDNFLVQLQGNILDRDTQGYVLEERDGVARGRSLRRGEHAMGRCPGQPLCNCLECFPNVDHEGSRNRRRVNPFTREILYLQSRMKRCLKQECQKPSVEVGPTPWSEERLSKAGYFTTLAQC